MKRMFTALCMLILLLTACGQVPFRPNTEISQAETLALHSSETDANREWASVFPRHEPYGNGIGAMPGRVAWAYDPDSVEWDGSGYWWELGHFDETAILEMTRNGIATLAGQENAISGWNRLFEAHNASHGRQGGYRPGQKIAIKANMNGAGTFGDDSPSRMSYINPVVLKALLVSLVEDADVAPENITVFDTARIFPQEMMELCSQGSLAGVQFRYMDLLGPNDAQADRSAPIVWSQNVSGDTNYLPTCVTEADYLINLAELKGHSYGITLTGKNHFGTLMNSSRLRPPEAAGIHRYLTQNRMNAYTVLVDLMANYQLGEKTVLYMLDAVICATSEGASISGENSRWQQSPFNGDYTSSLFFSQDPVALDSVGADFLMNEPTVTSRNSALRDNPNVENYLHEAALVADTPSGTVYYNGNGNRVTNLGVHEHWNNPTDKQYSRNLGADEGIELVRAGVDSADLPSDGRSAFTDVSPDAWYAQAVDYCRVNGLMNGISATTFAPEESMTRAMLAAVLYRMAGTPVVAGTDSFTDTVRGSWYSEAVSWAAQQGLIGGYGDGRFGPNDPVTREQMTAILWRYAGNPVAGIVPDFEDNAEIASYAKGAVAWASTNNIIAPVSVGCFAPKEQATRAQIAAALMGYAQYQQLQYLTP